jgi:UBX domain-containing protein 1
MVIRQTNDRHGAEKSDQQQDQSSSRFKGAGYTLGSDEAESTKVEDPNEAFRRAMAAGPPQVKRVLKLWKDGFSVDNGPLFRYDDPANKEYLEAINQGQAPLAVLNIQRGQHVDVTVQVSEEAYTPPPKEHKPFENQGHRLGSEIPPSASTSTAAPAQSTSTTATPTMDVDESQPQTQLNIRLAAGGRLVSAFNRTHTIDDVYGFIDRASPDSAGRHYVLLTPFPRREYPRGSKESLEAAGLLKGTLQQKFS